MLQLTLSIRRVATFVCGLLILLSVGPPVEAATTVLFESDGSSLADFPCDYGQQAAGAVVAGGSGNPAPSIEFSSPSLTRRLAAPYVLPVMEIGDVLHGSLNIQLLSSTGYVSLSLFGVPIGTNCSFPNPTSGDWPIPSLGVRTTSWTYQSWAYTEFGVQDSNLAVGGPVLPIGEWQTVEFRFERLEAARFAYSFTVGGNLLHSGFSYQAIDEPRDLGVEIGISGSGEPTQVRYDNIRLELVRTDGSGPISGGDANLVAHWDFESGSGTTVIDQTGNGHDGSTFGGPSWVASPIGGGNYALAFENGRAVEVPNHPDLLPSDHSYTVSAWFQTSVSGADQSIIRAQRGCCGNTSVLQISRIDDLLSYTFHNDRIVCCGDAPERAHVATSGPVTDGQWHHAVAVRDRPAGQVRLYLDGQLADTAPDTDANVNTTGTFGIGYRPSDAIGRNERFFQGLIDEIKIWDGALSTEQITELYQTDNPNGGGGQLGPTTTITQGPDSHVAMNEPLAFTARFDASAAGGTVGGAEYSLNGQAYASLSVPFGQSVVTQDISPSLPLQRGDGQRLCLRARLASTGVAGPAACVEFTVFDPAIDWSNVLFLPGIMGSELSTDAATIPAIEEPLLWLSALTLYRRVQCALRPDDAGNTAASIYSVGVLDSIPFPNLARFLGRVNVFDSADVYGDWKDHLEDLRSNDLIASWEAFPYDWRVDLESTLLEGSRRRHNQSVHLMDRLQVLASSSKTGKVTIVGHSMGGLLAKELLVSKQEAQEIVDRVIMVATPQLGVPHGLLPALHGLEVPILKPHIAREVGETMIGLQLLLPSAAFFDATAGTRRPIKFGQATVNTQLLAWRSRYGETISNPGDLRHFLTGGDGTERNELWDGSCLDTPEDSTADPNILPGSILDTAIATQNRGQRWNPGKVEVIQVAGVGLPTIFGIRYEPGVALAAIPSGNRITGSQVAPVESQNEVNLWLGEDEAGDGTVILESALAMPSGPGVRRFTIDLKRHNRSRLRTTPNRSHSSIMGVESLHQLIDNILSASNSPGDGVTFVEERSSEAMPRGFSESKWKVEIASPADLHAYDSNGLHTGPLEPLEEDADVALRESSIPNSAFRWVGHRQHVWLDKGDAYDIEVNGNGFGAFTLTIEEHLNEEVVASHRFVDIPVTPSSVARLQLGIKDEPDALVVDPIGDGAQLIQIQSGEAPDTGALLTLLAALIRSMELPTGAERSALAMVSNASRAVDRGDARTASQMLGVLLNLTDSGAFATAASDRVDGLRDATLRVLYRISNNQ